MIPEPRSPLAVQALLDALSVLADVQEVCTPGTVARLTIGPQRPTLWLSVDSPPEAQCWALLDVLRALTLGPEHAESARVVRRLRPVG